MQAMQLLPSICGGIAPLLIPPVHIAVLWYFWQNYSLEVDKQSCKCSCWDTVFKGTYESGVASYKHMYFNATENMVKIWMLTVVAIIALYECIKHLVLLIVQKKVRYTMLLLFGSTIFSHYYGWWMYVNYYNDDFYDQFHHQLFFSITELVCTGVVIHLANIDNEVTIRKILCIVGISILHITAGGFDQFFSNVIQGNGNLGQVIRDIWFMIPDIMHCALPLALLHQMRKETFSTQPFYMDRKYRRDIVFMICIVAVLFLILGIGINWRYLI